MVVRGLEAINLFQGQRENRREDLHLFIYAQRASLAIQPGLFLDAHLPVSLDHLGIDFRNEMLTEEALERFTNAVDRSVTLF